MHDGTVRDCTFVEVNIYFVEVNIYLVEVSIYFVDVNIYFVEANIVEMITLAHIIDKIKWARWSSSYHLLTK